jgi:hypothetical protein
MNIISALAEEAYKARQDVQASPEEWLALFLGEFSQLIIHEAASVANVFALEHDLDGQAMYDRIKKHFEVTEDVVYEPYLNNEEVKNDKEEG